MNNNCTYADRKFPDITLKDLEKIAIHKYDEPDIPTHKKTLIEKAMNRFGWYRKTKVIVIDSQQLMSFGGSSWLQQCHRRNSKD